MKNAYVLMPFAKEYDDIFAIIENAGRENGFIVMRADKKRDIGLITNSIVIDILCSDLIIADISGFNPNVMYEMGLAHTLNKPTILLSQELGRNEKLPFDISHMVTIPYKPPTSSTGEEAKDLREGLIRYINAQINHSNPISNSLSSNQIKLFRSQFEYFWGLERTFTESYRANEVWMVSNSLFWEQLSPLFNRMIEERMVAGKRKTYLMLPDHPEMVDASEIYLSALKRKDPASESALKILHITSDDLFAFLATEICIYDPFKPSARAVLMEPMCSIIGEDPADTEIENNITAGKSNILANLRENSFDIALSKNTTRKLSSIFKRVWNTQIIKQDKTDDWILEFI